MKSAYKLQIALVSFCAIAAAIHARPQDAAKPSMKQAAAGSANSVSAVLDRQLSMVEKSVVSVAEAMPEEKYSFTPESLNISGSDFKTVRNFDQQVLHIATANYFYYGAVTGDKPPDGLMGASPADKFKTKDGAVQVLKDSFDLGHKAIATLTSENMLEELPMRRGMETRLFLASFPAIHSYDIYGQMVEYLRMNGIVPPASAPKK